MLPASNKVMHHRSERHFKQQETFMINSLIWRHDALFVILIGKSSILGGESD